MKYEWPGNIRELENVLFEYALNKISLAPGSTLNSRGSEAVTIDGLPPSRTGIKALGNHAARVGSQFVSGPHNGSRDA
jgi:DNA-binding NtrC family response regulator